MTFARRASVQTALALLASSLPSVALPQAAGSPPPTQQEQQERAAHSAAVRSYAAGADDPSLADGLLNALSGVTVEAGQADQKAKIKVAFRSGMALTLTTPVPRGSDAASFFDTLDGLNDSLNLALSYSKKFEPAFVAVRGAGPSGALVSACEEARIDLGSCSETKIAKEGGFRAQRMLLTKTFARETVPFITLEGKIGRTVSTYFESDGAEQERLRVPFSIALAGGQVGQKTILFAKARFQRSFEDGDEAQRCTPIEGSPELETCRKLPFGPPEEKNAFVVAGGFRHLGPDLGLSLSAGYDTEKKKWAIEVPVYFLRDGEERFTGGVRFKWQQDDRLLVNVFVSTPLTVDP